MKISTGQGIAIILVGVGIALFFITNYEDAYRAGYAQGRKDTIATSEATFNGTSWNCVGDYKCAAEIQ